MKQLFILFMMMISMSVFSEVKTINLSPVNSLVVNCPKGNELELKNNTLKCVCPKGTTARLEGEILMCDITCEIKQERIEYWDEVLADQTAVVISREFISYDALVVKDLRGKVLSRERIYSPRKVEFDFLFNEALRISRDSCQRVFYNGKEIKN